jgi:2-oxoglutarate dehydrogenase E2 component (dihydrolipoamide succinyltransferase)
MATEIKMPQLGESVVEGTITKWLKQEGDSVDEDELLVEVSTDKVDSEVPSSTAGTIQRILVQEGETVKVGTAIAVVGEGGAEAGGDGAAAEATAEEDSSGDAQAKGDAAEQAVAEEQGQDGGGQEPEDAPQEAQAEEESETEAEPQEEGEAEPPSAQKGQEDAPDADTSKRGIISPLVRRLADEHGVNLDEVQGTGTGGRIRKQDILAHVDRAKEKPAAAAEAPEREEAPQRDEAAAAPPAERAAGAVPEGAAREELVPWTNIRRRTAEHMAASARETARAWNAVEADWTSVVSLRERVKKRFSEREGFNLTYTPFLAQAVCETLLEMPEVNATFDEDNQGNRVKHYVNLGIAVALEGGGLIVPVIKGADEKNLVGLARAMNDIVTRARSKKLSPDDLAGGTFTITNPGPFGSIISVPIIPRGQTAILGFEAIEKRIVVTDDDAIAIRSRGFLSLSWDHRIIDGAEAARFLARLKENVQTTDFSSDLAHYL